MNKSFVYNYLVSRDVAMSPAERDKLRDELNALKKQAIGNLKNLLSQAKNNLEANGCRVFVVKDYDEAGAKIKELIGDAKQVVKSKSNTLDKLNLRQVLSAEITDTDLGAYIVSQIGGESDHPVLPAIGMSAAEIAEKFNNLSLRGAEGDEAIPSLNDGIPIPPQAGLPRNDRIILPNDARGIVDNLKAVIKKKIDAAEAGLTGANAITASGEILILENEGNAGLTARLPKKHVAVAKIEKIVENLESALIVARAATVWGTGQKQTSYINIISGPSQTADIGNELIGGVQGAQEVDVILIEGDAAEKIGTELESMLYCIHCGACYNLCPSWNLAGVMPKVADFERNLFHCTLCENCTSNCPAKIDWQSITRICRAQFTSAGQQTQANEKMIDNIRQFGNPFGEIPAGTTPDKLFCC